jgi:nucleoside-diphosphate-sugar epimerase
MFAHNDLYQKDLQHIIQEPLPWEQLKNTSILITGATGMIGTVLVDALMLRNHKYHDCIHIYAMGRSYDKAEKRFADYFNNEFFSFISADVNQPLSFKEHVDYIFHCASNTHPQAYATDPIGTIMTNVLGTDHILQLARDVKARRTVFLSTVEVYGENRGDVDQFQENYCGYIDCNTLRAGYPEGKRTGEALCQAYIHKYGLDIVIPRICRVFGPTMLNSDSKALAQFIKNAAHGNNIVLKSEGTQYFSYCYAADAVSALLHILLKGNCGETYNIASSSYDIHLRDLAKILADIAGTEVVFELPNAVEQKGFSKASVARLDASKLIQLGWKPHETFYYNLKNTIEILKRE